MDWRAKGELFEQIRREYEFGIGTIKGVARQLSPLHWTCNSVRTLATALRRKGHEASSWRAWTLLRDMKDSLQGNRQREEGHQHPDRHA